MGNALVTLGWCRAAELRALAVMFCYARNEWTLSELR